MMIFQTYYALDYWDYFGVADFVLFLIGSESHPVSFVPREN